MGGVAQASPKAGVSDLIAAAPKAKAKAKGKAKPKPKAKGKAKAKAKAKVYIPRAASRFKWLRPCAQHLDALTYEPVC